MFSQKLFTNSEDTIDIINQLIQTNKELENGLSNETILLVNNKIKNLDLVYDKKKKYDDYIKNQLFSTTSKVDLNNIKLQYLLYRFIILVNMKKKKKVKINVYSANPDVMTDADIKTFKEIRNLPELEVFNYKETTKGLSDDELKQKLKDDRTSLLEQIQYWPSDLIEKLLVILGIKSKEMKGGVFGQNILSNHVRFALDKTSLVFSKITSQAGPLLSTALTVGASYMNTGTVFTILSSLGGIALVGSVGLLLAAYYDTLPNWLDKYRSSIISGATGTLTFIGGVYALYVNPGIVTFVTTLAPAIMGTGILITIGLKIIKSLETLFGGNVASFIYENTKESAFSAITAAYIIGNLLYFMLPGVLISTLLPQVLSTSLILLIIKEVFNNICIDKPINEDTTYFFYPVCSNIIYILNLLLEKIDSFTPYETPAKLLAFTRRSDRDNNRENLRIKKKELTASQKYLDLTICELGKSKKPENPELKIFINNFKQFILQFHELVELNITKKYIEAYQLYNSHIESYEEKNGGPKLVDKQKVDVLEIEAATLIYMLIKDDDIYKIICINDKINNNFELNEADLQSINSIYRELNQFILHINKPRNESMKIIHTKFIKTNITSIKTYQKTAADKVIELGKKFDIKPTTIFTTIKSYLGYGGGGGQYGDSIDEAELRRHAIEAAPKYINSVIKNSDALAFFSFKQVQPTKTQDATLKVINTNTQELKQLTDEKEKLEKRLKEATTQIAQLKGTNTDLKKTKERTQITTQLQQIEKLEAVISAKSVEKDKEVAKVKQELSTIKAKNETLDAELKQFKAKQANLEKQLGEKEKAATELQAELEKATREFKELQSTPIAQTAVAPISGTLTDAQLAQQFTTLPKEEREQIVLAKSKQIQDLNQRITQINTEKEAGASELQQLKSANETTAQELARSIQSMTSIQEELAAAKAEAAIAKKELIEKEASLKSQYAALEAKQKSMDTNKSAIEATIRDFSFEDINMETITTLHQEINSRFDRIKEPYNLLVDQDAELTGPYIEELKQDIQNSVYNIDQRIKYKQHQFKLELFSGLIDSIRKETEEINMPKYIQLKNDFNKDYQKLLSNNAQIQQLKNTIRELIIDVKSSDMIGDKLNNIKQKYNEYTQLKQTLQASIGAFNTQNISEEQTEQLVTQLKTKLEEVKAKTTPKYIESEESIVKTKEEAIFEAEKSRERNAKQRITMLYNKEMYPYTNTTWYETTEETLNMNAYKALLTKEVYDLQNAPVEQRIPRTTIQKAEERSRVFNIHLDDIDDIYTQLVRTISDYNTIKFKRFEKIVDKINNDVADTTIIDDDRTMLETYIRALIKDIDEQYITDIIDNQTVADFGALSDAPILGTIFGYTWRGKYDINRLIRGLTSTEYSYSINTLNLISFFKELILFTPENISLMKLLETIKTYLYSDYTDKRNFVIRMLTKAFDYHSHETENMLTNFDNIIIALYTRQGNEQAAIDIGSLMAKYKLIPNYKHLFEEQYATLLDELVKPINKFPKELKYILMNYLGLLFQYKANMLTRKYMKHSNMDKYEQKYLKYKQKYYELKQLQ